MTSESQVIVYNPNVDLTERKSALNNSIQEAVTVGDLRGYKVYTALLTQNGGDDPMSLGVGDSLVIGVTYFIENNGGSGWDFTNVGAPNNDLFTSFVATGTTPNSWGIDGYLNYNTGAPVVTVLENTIGNIWFTYLNIGTYIISSNSLFTINKTATFTTTSSKPNEPYWITMQAISQEEIYLVQFGVDGSTYNNLLSTPIEIRVYN